MSVLWKKGELLVVNRFLAQKIGLNEAMLLQQISYWLEERECGTEYQGRKWIYNTHQQWAEQFPFWSVDTVKRTLQSLANKGLIFVAKLNSHKRDHTNFYSLNTEQIALIDEGILHSSKGAKAADVKRANCTDLSNRTKTTQKTTAETSGIRAAEIGLIGVSDELLADWNKVRKDKKAGEATAAAVKLLQAEARKANLTDSEAITVCCGFGWQGFRAAWYLKDMAAAAMTPNRSAQQNTHKHAAAAAAIYEGVWDA